MFGPGGDAHIICLGRRGRAKALFFSAFRPASAEGASFLPPRAGELRAADEAEGSWMTEFYCYTATVGGGPLRVWLEDVDLGSLTGLAQPSRGDYGSAEAVLVIYDASSGEGLAQAKGLLDSVVEVWDAEAGGVAALVGVREAGEPGDPANSPAPSEGQESAASASWEAYEGYMIKRLAGVLLPSGEQAIHCQLALDPAPGVPRGPGRQGPEESAAALFVRDVLKSVRDKRKVEFDPYEL